MAKKGMKTKADMDNHANQLNPNNKRYKPKKNRHAEQEAIEAIKQNCTDENYDDDLDYDDDWDDDDEEKDWEPTEDYPTRKTWEDDQLSIMYPDGIDDGEYLDDD